MKFYLFCLAFFCVFYSYSQDYNDFVESAKWETPYEFELSNSREVWIMLGKITYEYEDYSVVTVEKEINTASGIRGQSIICFINTKDKKRQYEFMLDSKTQLPISIKENQLQFSTINHVKTELLFIGFPDVICLKNILEECFEKN